MTAAINTTGHVPDKKSDSSGTIRDGVSYCQFDNVPHENRLFVISRSGSGEVMYLVLTEDKLDFQSNKIKLDHWEATKDLVDFGVAVINNCVYILGGYDKTIAKNTTKVHRYNAGSGTWTECRPFHMARCKFGVGVVDDTIIISGGERNGGKVTGSCEVYNTTTDSWEKLAMLISPRMNHSCLVYRKDVYCAGGFHENRNHSNLWVYEHYKWSQLDEDYPQKLPFPLDRCSTITVDGIFYFIGGISSRISSKLRTTRFFTQNDVFTYCATISLDQDITEASDMLSPWNYRIPSLHNHRHSAGTIQIGKRIYVIGGSNLETGRSVRQVEYYDLKLKKWEDDFIFRKGDVSNVVCAILRVPTIPANDKQPHYKLKWVLW